MKTTKPISTISFNTPEYLEQRLKELTKNKHISFWAFIRHKPEQDDCSNGKKFHQHVYIEPSKLLQTDDLKDCFKEFDPTFPDKPLGCLTFTRSVWSEWYLYGLHDEAYLLSKFQSRQFHYSIDDVVSSSYDDLLYHIQQIDYTPYGKMTRIREAILAGTSLSDLLFSGAVPLALVSQFEKYYKAVAVFSDIHKLKDISDEKEVEEVIRNEKFRN